MTLDELRQKVQEWDQANPDDNPIAQAKYTSILTQIEYHAKNEWKVYLPAENPGFSSNYMERLAMWVGNVQTEDDQKLLLQYALQISFFSHDDFVALYRTALYREVFPWVAAQANIKFDQLGWSNFSRAVSDIVFNKTWFCPITDSMDINEFYKVNRLTGIGFRPGFATLKMMAKNIVDGDSKISEIWNNYMKSLGMELDYLVLLEDVVGSGSQCFDSVMWAAEHINVPILFIPLILCPNGADILRQEESRWSGKLIVRPIVELHRCDLLGPERKGDAQSWSISADLEDLVNRHKTMSSPNRKQFGYKETGCSVATFSNTPDNTLPIVHYSCPRKAWNPLFPRVFRN